MKQLTNIFKSDKFLAILDQSISSGFGFVITIFLARELSASDFGLFSSLILIGFLLISFSNSLIIQPFQVAPQHYKSEPTYIAFLFTTQLIFCFILIPAICITNYALKQYNLSSLNLVIFFTGLLLNDFFRKYFLAIGNIRLSVIFDSLVVFFQFIGYLILYYMNNLELSSVLYVVSVSFFLVAISAIIYINPFTNFNSSLSKYVSFHYREGRWLSLVSFVQWGSSNFIVLAIGAIINIEAVGAFRLVQSLFGILNIVFQTYENYVLPCASKLHALSAKKSKTYLQQVSIKSSLTTAVLLIIIFYFSNQIMILVGGDKYRAYSYIIKGMSVLYFILFIGYPVRLSIRMLLLSSHFFIGYLLAFIFSMLFFKQLISSYQLNGIIYGLIINQIIMISYWAYQLHKNKFYIWK